jgi:hypothetical protein
LKEYYELRVTSVGHKVADAAVKKEGQTHYLYLKGQEEGDGELAIGVIDTKTLNSKWTAFDVRVVSEGGSQEQESKNKQSQKESAKETQPVVGKIRKPDVAKEPASEERESVGENSGWYVPLMTIAVVVLAGVVIFLLLRWRQKTA